jgi:hypothetical protein
MIMAHHKRGKRKDLRAGCSCKYWKMNGMPEITRHPVSELRRLQLSSDEIEDAEIPEGKIDRLRVK